MDNKLLKIIIVDDEQNTINLLKLCIPWSQLNMEVIGEANCGIEALDLIEESKPDIVLTDIQMPYMDGIALSQQILERYMDINVVIITAHEQFDYAQKAISIGVSDFILKPIDPAIITSTLKNLQSKIYEHRQRLLYLETSFKYVQNNLKELRSKFLNDLIHGSFDNVQIFKDLKIANVIINNSDSHIQVSVINIYFDSIKYTTIKKQMILQNCINYIEESYCMDKNLYVFEDTYGNIVLLNNDPLVYLPEISEHITLYLKSNLNTNVYCGIGNMVSEISKIATSYEQAKNALKLCCILNENVVSYHSYINSPMESNSTNHSLNDLDILIKLGLKKQAITATSKLLSLSLQEDVQDLSNTKLLAIDISSKIVTLLTQNGISLASLNFINLSYSNLINLQLYSDIEKYTTDIISQACSLMNNLNKHNSNDTVSQIIKYLESNYNDDTISLSSLAKQFYINSSYLSRIFKSETNKSFSEYLVELRIQKSLQLLQVADYKAYQLAQMVGIPDPIYFVKCFKKVTGIGFQEFKSIAKTQCNLKDFYHCQ